jgi:hypothetical protein
MSQSEEDHGDRAMLWFNLIGISLATALLGTFFWFYGEGFLSLLMLLFGNQGHWPDH